MASLVSDSVYKPFCLDQSDKPSIMRGIGSLQSWCSHSLIDQCEERTCTFVLSSHFACGDGQCIEWAPPSTEALCINGRDLLSTRHFLNATFIYLDDPCWSAIVCLLQFDTIMSLDSCDQEEALLNIRFCPAQFFFPKDPIIQQHVQLIYEANKTDWLNNVNPSYVCFDSRRCRHLRHQMKILNSTCVPFNTLIQTEYDSWDDLLYDLYDIFRSCSLIVESECTRKNSSTLFECNSLCLSKYRLIDHVVDCPMNETNVTMSCSYNLSHAFHCQSEEKCLAPWLVQDGIQDCQDGEDEPRSKKENLTENFIFQQVCDGFVEIQMNETETDETNCMEWPCDTPYTRCDNVWQCADGRDELNCTSKKNVYPTDCYLRGQHICVNPITGSWDCLPQHLAGDGYVHCLGGSDEQSICSNAFPHELQRRFLCGNSVKNTLNTTHIHCIDVMSVCDCLPDCPNSDDELVCPWLQAIVNTGKCMPEKFYCQNQSYGRSSRCNGYGDCSLREDEILCDLAIRMRMEKYFQTGYLPEYPSSLSAVQLPKVFSKNKEDVLTIPEVWYCHRGILVYDSWHNPLCLCPPAYYGSFCQYQNERVTVVLRLNKMSTIEPLLIFRLVVMLMNENRGTIVSHEQIAFAPQVECQPTHVIYLLYPKRPRNRSENYAVRIDVFSIHIFQNDIQFRISYFQRIPFNFLPVYRVAMDLIIPLKTSTRLSSCSLLCQHGYCHQYHHSDVHYCRCDSGWTGKLCSEKYESRCAPGAIDVNQNICVCPPGRIGRRCFAPVVACHSSPCVNGGTCIPLEHPNWLQFSYRCYCKSEHFGFRCEFTYSRLTISASGIPRSPSFSMRVHLVYTQTTDEPIQSISLHSLGLQDTSVTILVEKTPNLMFVELDKQQFYLGLILKPSLFQELGSAAPVRNLSVDLMSSHRCSFVGELLSRDLLSHTSLRRIKYYQRPCRERPSLKCFYDETRMCICTHQNNTDCFRFDLKTKFDCYGYNYCENGGECYQSSPVCPVRSQCSCAECYFGTRCQFSTLGFSFSLDTIIGYQIAPFPSINRQPLIVKLSLATTLMLSVLGLISNLFSIVTFVQKNCQQVGCGQYLLASSIVSLLSTIAFVLKFLSLLLSQMNLVQNHTLTLVTCIAPEFLLKLLPTTAEWLNACVAVERVFTVTLGTSFNKTKSQKIARWVILLVLFINTATAVHDPLYRQILDDVESKRRWCLVNYRRHSSILYAYNTTLNVIHVLVPFLINFISAFVIIISTARNRTVTRKQHSFKTHLREQLTEHRHLLVSPCVLVLITIPRLIIALAVGCMKSAGEPTIYLVAYFIPLLTSVVTFIIFIVPSRVYWQEYTAVMKRSSHALRRRFIGTSNT